MHSCTPFVQTPQICTVNKSHHTIVLIMASRGGAAARKRAPGKRVWVSGVGLLCVWMGESGVEGLLSSRNRKKGLRYRTNETGGEQKKQIQ